MKSPYWHGKMSKMYTEWTEQVSMQYKLCYLFLWEKKYEIHHQNIKSGYLSVVGWQWLFSSVQFSRSVVSVLIGNVYFLALSTVNIYLIKMFLFIF